MNNKTTTTVLHDVRIRSKKDWLTLLSGGFVDGFLSERLSRIFLALAHTKRFPLSAANQDRSIGELGDGDVVASLS